MKGVGNIFSKEKLVKKRKRRKHIGKSKKKFKKKISNSHILKTKISKKNSRKKITKP